MASENGKIYFNGIDATTGGYWPQPLDVGQIVRAAQGEEPEAAHVADLKHRTEQSTLSHFGLNEGLDPKELSQSGWGILFAQSAGSRALEIRDALSELLRLRQSQAGERYREFMGPQGYQASDSKNRFLARHGTGPGPVDPDRLPYYLLIVGDLHSIPFGFQYQLGVQHAVGRLHLDRIEDYAHYAHSVVEAEKGNSPLPRKAVFFAPQNPGDPPTRMCCDHLVRPLSGSLAASQPDWEVEDLIEGQATKSRLSQLLESPQAALLFTAGHGTYFPCGHPMQADLQGSLVCQDWPGPGSGGVHCDHFFAGADVSAEARFHGLLTFHFACYSAGTPQMDYFAGPADQSLIAQASPSPFLAALPKRLLSHPKGGALAAVGHVERTWECSFSWGRQARITVFEATLKRLMEGHPVGSAMEYFSQRYAELTAMLSEEQESSEFGARPDPEEVACLWQARNDARSYVIIGDPAVRLAASGGKARPGQAASAL